VSWARPSGSTSSCSAGAPAAETGYARMSIEAIARRAGVGKAALYRRWPSKQEMLSELIPQRRRGHTGLGAGYRGPAQ
jgi:hypothetical protein